MDYKNGKLTNLNYYRLIEYFKISTIPLYNIFKSIENWLNIYPFVYSGKTNEIRNMFGKNILHSLLCA